MSVFSYPSISIRRFAIVLLALATAGVLYCGTSTKALAQDGGFPADRFFGNAFDMQRSLYFWLNYTDGDSYGGANQHVQLGGTKYFSLDNGALLLTGQGLVTDRGNGGASLGVVRRWLVSSYFLGDVVIGAGGHWDLTQSPYGNDYNQVVGNLELLTENWGLRLTGYGPVGERVNTLSSMSAGGASGMPFFQGNFLFSGGQMTRTDEVALGGIEIELARSIGNLFGAGVGNDAAEVYVGYYNLQGAVGEQGHGVKGGLRGYLLPSVAANVTVSNDNLFGTGVYGGFTWFFGGSGGNLPRSIEDKLTIPVYRNQQVATNEVETTVGGGMVQLTQGGQPITFMHVNDSGVAGDGTVENPHGALTDANSDPNKANRDIAYVHSGTSFNNQSYAAAPNQRVLGEGGNNTQNVNTDQLGVINIPQVNGLGNPRPVIQNSTGAALAAANNSEISNFVIANSNTAIELSSLTGNVNVNRTLISGGGTGIDILGGTGTFTFTDVSVADPTGAGIHVDGGSSTINFGGPNDPVNGLFGPSVLTQSGGGTGILVEGGHTGMFNQNPSSPIFADSGDGLQFDNANGQYNFNGPVTLAGGDAGIDILGGSAGTFTFSNTDISSPTGDAVHIDGGTADVTFGSGSSVTQANNASAVKVQGDHTGQLNFDGTITATNGDGLQFGALTPSGADGSYNFNGMVTLNGGDAGIDIFNSLGDFTFADATITSPTYKGVYIRGGSASLIYNGNITQANNQAAVDIVDHNNTPGESITFQNGTINATNGSGLFFYNADGNYNFDDTVTLNGNDAGIDIRAGSTGTFTFADTTIISPAGHGVNIDGLGGTSQATVSYTGGSITQANSGRTINIADHSTGTIDIDVPINATNGTGLQFSNADGTYNFNGQVTLNGGDAGIDILSDSAGTFTFSNTDITDPTGIGLNIHGGSADVTFEAPSSIVQNTFNQPLVDAMGGHTGTVTFELGTNLEATNGTGLQFVDADGTYIFNGDITLNGTANSADTGIDIISDSAGTFTFSGTFADPQEITNDQGVAVNMDNSPGSATFSDLHINQSVGAGVRANNSGSLTLDFIDIDNTTDDGINVTNTNLTVNLVQIGLDVGIGDDGIEVVNNDGTDRTATILGNNIFELAGTGIANRGIFINSSGTGTLEADVRFNFIVSTNQTILTTSGPTAGSLILDLQNSTLTTDTPGVFTEEHVGGGLHSTIVRSWDSPNQVTGSVIPGTAGGGILFDQVTFDADANPGNGYQQVQFTGDLDIGSVPPLTVTRVTGDGLSFINPTGDLSIDTLNIANFNGTGLEVDTKGLGTTFNLVTGGGTINTVGGPAMFLDPPAAAPPLSVDLTFENVTSLDSPQVGLYIDSVTGDVNITGTTTILNYGAGPITVQNSPSLNLNWGNLITK